MGRFIIGVGNVFVPRVSVINDRRQISVYICVCVLYFVYDLRKRRATGRKTASEFGNILVEYPLRPFIYVYVEYSLMSRRAIFVEPHWHVGMWRRRQRVSQSLARSSLHNNIRVGNWPESSDPLHRSGWTFYHQYRPTWVWTVVSSKKQNLHSTFLRRPSDKKLNRIPQQTKSKIWNALLLHSKLVCTILFYNLVTKIKKFVNRYL